MKNVWLYVFVFLIAMVSVSALSTDRLLSYYDFDYINGDLIDMYGSYDIPQNDQSFYGRGQRGQTIINYTGDGAGNGNFFAGTNVYQFNNSDSFTVNMWIYRSDDCNGYEWLFDLGNPTQNGELILQIYCPDTGNVLHIGSGGSDTYFSSSIPLNTWTMITVVYNGTWTGSYYRYDAYRNTGDNVWQGNTYQDSAMSQNIRVGTYDDNGNYPATGFYIDEVSIFNRTLSYDEIVELYNDGYGLFFNGSGFESYNNTVYNNGLDAYFSMDSEYQLVDDWTGYYNGTFGQYGVFRENVFARQSYSANFTNPYYGDANNTIDIYTSAVQFDWDGFPYAFNVWAYPFDGSLFAGNTNQYGLFTGTTGTERNLIVMTDNSGSPLLLMLARDDGVDWLFCQTNITIPEYLWSMITINFYNGSDIYVYVNTFNDSDNSIVSKFWNCNWVNEVYPYIYENEFYDEPFNPYGLGNISFATCDYNSGYNCPYFGLIDEVSVWNRTLSNVEIDSLFNYGDGIPLNNIMDEPCTNFSADMLTILTPTQGETILTDWIYTEVFVNTTGQNCYANYTFGLDLNGWENAYTEVITVMNETLYTYNFTGYANGEYEVTTYLMYPAVEETYELIESVFVNVSVPPCTNFSENALVLYSPIPNVTYYQDWLYVDILVNASGQDCYPDYDLEIGVVGNSCNYVDCSVVDQTGFTNMNETRYIKNITGLNESGTYTISAVLYFPTSTQEYFDDDSFSFDMNYTAPIPEPVPPSDEQIVSATNNSLVSMLVLYIIIGTVLALILFYADSFPVSDDVKTWIVYVTVAVLVVFGIIVLTTVFRAFASLT